MNILVMAGTRDAVEIIKKLKKFTNSKIIATTTTDYGAKIAKDAGSDKVISKALNKERLVKVLKMENVDIIIDATHPFAVKATENAIEASEETQIFYIRFERPSPKLKGNIWRVESFKEAGRMAAKILEEENGNLLHLAGVSTLKDIIEEVGKKRTIVRVLPYSSSIRACHRLGVDGERIIAMQGTFSSDLNREIMREYNAKVVITKDSGSSGGLLEKVKAAEDLGIPIIVVNRPTISRLNKKPVFKDSDEILTFLSTWNPRSWRINS